MPTSITDKHFSDMNAYSIPSAVSCVRPLHGMKAICAYLGKSESTALKYIREEHLPAVKIGGEWVSDEGRIDVWRLQRIG